MSMSEEFKAALENLPSFEGFVPPVLCERGRKFKFPKGSPRPIPAYEIEEAIASAHLLDEGWLPSEWEYLIDYHDDIDGTYAVVGFEGEVADTKFVSATQLSGGGIVTDPGFVRYGILGEGYIAKLLPGAIVKSRSQIEKEEEESIALVREERIDSAQKFLGWQIQSIGRTIVLVSPDGETAEICPNHEVWDYGDRSRSWLEVGGIPL